MLTYPDQSLFTKPRIAGLSVLTFSLLFLLYTHHSPSPLLSILEAEEAEFHSFISTYQKLYSAEEHPKRFSIFLDNLGFIRKYNSMQSSVVLGVNKFADLTQNEFASIFLNPEEKVVIPDSFAANNVEALPSSVDWVAAGMVTGVKDQGRCGSCYAFAATGAIESAWAISKKLAAPLPTFSEQQIMDCSGAFGNEGCGGGYAWTSLAYVVKNKGINSEEGYPYTALDGTCNATLEAEIVATITKYQNVSAFNYVALQTAVVQQPVATSVEVNVLWRLYQSGVITQDCGYNLNHAVLITGYQTGDVPYWNVKNSWGTSWGMNGYIQIGMSAGIGVCGINTRPVYPVI